MRFLTERVRTHVPKGSSTEGVVQGGNFGDRDFGFFCKGHHLCSKLIFEHSWLLTLMEEAGYISPVLINQLEVLKAQNAFKEKENRVTYLPFFPQRSNRGCSQGCSRTQANLMRLYIKKLFHNA